LETNLQKILIFRVDAKAVEKMNHDDNVELVKTQLGGQGYDIGSKGSKVDVDFSATRISPSPENNFVIVVDQKINGHELTEKILKLEAWANGRKPRYGVGWGIIIVVMNDVPLSEQFRVFWKKPRAKIMDTRTNMIPGTHGGACHDSLVVYPENDPRVDRNDNIHDISFEECHCCDNIIIPDFPEQNYRYLINYFWTPHQQLSEEQIVCYNLKMACYHALRCDREGKNHIVQVIWKNNPLRVPIIPQTRKTFEIDEWVEHPCWVKFKECLKKNGWKMTHSKKAPNRYTFIKRG